MNKTEEFLKGNYQPVGDLAGTPHEIVWGMLQRANEQYTYLDTIGVMENNAETGFVWNDTEEGLNFWESVVSDKNYQTYYDKYHLIVAKWLMAPDGTMLPSFYNHDYRTHEMPDGRVTTVDGGRNEIYSTNTNWKVTDMTVYNDDPLEVRRRFFCRLNIGAEGRDSPTWIPLFKMSDAWLEATIEYMLDGRDYTPIYAEEKLYRKSHGIEVPE